MTALNKPSVLYVDDELNCLKAFTASFRRPYRIYTAINSEEAKVILAENEIHILLTDQRMPNTPGTTLLEYAVKNYPRQVRILISAYSDYAALMLAVQKGHIIDFIEKPWDFDDLKRRIDYAYTVYCGNIEEERKRTETDEANRKTDDDINRLLGNN